MNSKTLEEQLSHDTFCALAGDSLTCLKAASGPQLRR